MDNEEKAKPYELEERTAVFAEQGRDFVKKLPRTIGNIEDAKQFIRASGSVGANYIEANESIGKKDFLMKIKTCRRRSEGKPLLAALA
jgi:four helix bundle protein